MVGAGQDNSRSANAGKDHRVNLLRVEDFVQGVTSTGIVSRLGHHNVIVVKRLEGFVQLPLGAAFGRIAETFSCLAKGRIWSNLWPLLVGKVDARKNAEGRRGLFMDATN